MQSIRPRWAFRLRNPLWPGRTRRIIERPSLLHPTTRHSSGVATTDKDFAARVQEVKDSGFTSHPRLSPDSRTVTCAEFRKRYSGLENEQTVEDTLVVHGRIRTYRLAGSKLIFFDIVQDGQKLQVMCNQRQLDGVAPAEFKKLYRLLRRGDAFSVTGKPHRTSRGELTVLGTELPKLLSPCLHDVPVDAEKLKNSPYPRHVQFLADAQMTEIVLARASIIQYLRQFFLDRSFMEVNTPILAASAGGAAARPFYTSATEFPDRQLSLRIAPELWLKRLVIGGFDRVFEIGPSFRNEGIDKTHNPEFTTCEFYHAYANLEDLMSTTEKLLSGMAALIRNLNTDGTLKPTEADFFLPFRRIDFITGIEEQTGRNLPDLTTPTATDDLKDLFTDLSLPLPDNPTLPRLLDELASIYLEPKCTNPTFITNHPECLSPLSKSFIHPTLPSHRVAARAELFIDGREIVNTYEEETSPDEQRRKFEIQASRKVEKTDAGTGAGADANAGADPDAHEVDEGFLEALEWGLPPTGGWGCGVDRLVMLFTGATRIGDVIPFGSLRMVTRRAGRREGDGDGDGDRDGDARDG